MKSLFQAAFRRPTRWARLHRGLVWSRNPAFTLIEIALPARFRYDALVAGARGQIPGLTAFRRGSRDPLPHLLAFDVAEAHCAWHPKANPTPEQSF